MLCAKMAKWSYVFVKEWLIVFMIFLHGCSAVNFYRKVCLETPFDFAWGKKACRFTLEDAKRLLIPGDCLQKCEVKINGLYGNEYELESLVLSFNGFGKNTKTINMYCSNEYITKSLKINCRTGFVNEDLSQDLCTSTKGCGDGSKICSGLQTEQIGVCLCPSEYLGIGNKCFKRNLKLNDTCHHNEQCTEIPGSVCENDTCACKPGYSPLNDSECRLLLSDGYTEASIGVQKENNAASVIVGSIFGGLILGVILTVLTVNIYQNIRYGKTKTEEKECREIAVFNNTTYETETDASLRIPAVHRTNDSEVVNVPPFAHSVEFRTPKNVQETNKSLMANRDVNVDVYNHLHEKEDCNEENYDHLRGNLDHENEESDYSNLHAGGRYMELDVSASVNDDYCSLKKQ
ncbi:uncharacterized protein LOC134232603 isoform X2 [Saccostrea cucullata]|uniref:uncharacterized protein LOC134232603 isoform X2 n=1 Tax=Saccostrea cuccullata TaxID=36930 RepID=UPI002ED185E4